MCDKTTQIAMSAQLRPEILRRPDQRQNTAGQDAAYRPGMVTGKKRVEKMRVRFGFGFWVTAFILGGFGPGIKISKSRYRSLRNWRIKNRVCGLKQLH